MNKLLNEYYKILYFCKGKPTTLEKLSNWELNGILLLIAKYPQGLLNGYSKEHYVMSIKYILNERLCVKDYKRAFTETRLADKSFDRANQLTNNILQCMLKTEKQYNKKLTLIQ